jgi:arginyl-tRNA synthetase
MSFIKETEMYLKEVLKKCGYELEDITLESSSRRDLGDFQINCAMSLAKKYGKNPREIAQTIVDNLDDRFDNVNIAGPGFINVSVNENKILEKMNKAINNFEELIDKQEEKKIIVDYGGANAAKALHVGHMRSPNIGEAIKRLLKLYGNEVLGDVHLGDLGRQAGMLISQLMEEQPNLPFFDENYTGEYPKINLTLADLKRMYPLANQEALKNPERMELVRHITSEIDKGNKAYTELWKQMVELSTVSIKETYDKLNCTFELWEGELDAFKYIPNVMEILKPYLYESEGALVMDVKKEDDKVDMPPLMVIKNDGATIYATRDLGTIYSRMERFNPDEMWYFTDQRQALYFEQVFRGSYISGLVPETTKLLHFGFGTLNGPGGQPFKTRDGGVMDLNELILELKKEIDGKIKPEITGAEREEIADKLAIATLKYTDLLPHRKTDYIFDPVKFSALEGKTGPYILYTIVRIKSLLRKADGNSYNLKTIANEEVRDVLLKMIELPNALRNSLTEASTNYICDILYDITSLYNKFYNNHNILNEEDMNKKESYLALSKIVYNVCHNLLDILAIDEIDKM